MSDNSTVTGVECARRVHSEQTERSWSSEYSEHWVVEHL